MQPFQKLTAKIIPFKQRSPAFQHPPSSFSSISLPPIPPLPKEEHRFPEAWQADINHSSFKNLNEKQTLWQHTPPHSCTPTGSQHAQNLRHIHPALLTLLFLEHIPPSNTALAKRGAPPS
ncbi:hypothetical protein [Bartonella grahamii]|uniref:hypothetical protein n=1 Tax=Bartonella grahamii TaxID=33045 RepID=UPI002E7BBEC8|nr:hypothetical protein [Bartonella grahamii]